MKELDNLLNKKTVFGKYFRFNLVELILPFVNLSVADANKGKQAAFIYYLLFLIFVQFFLLIFFGHSTYFVP